VYPGVSRRLSTVGAEVVPAGRAATARSRNALAAPTDLCQDVHPGGRGCRHVDVVNWQQFLQSGPELR
jgi:hypothetical protein